MNELVKHSLFNFKCLSLLVLCLMLSSYNIVFSGNLKLKNKSKNYSAKFLLAKYKLTKKKLNKKNKDTELRAFVLRRFQTNPAAARLRPPISQPLRRTFGA